MPKLRRLFDDLSAELRDKAPLVARLLRPGLDSRRIEKILQHYPCDLPEELVELYRWRNGTRLPFFEFVPGYRFLSLQKAVKAYRRQIRIARDVSEDWESVWDPTWFPVFELDASQLLLVVGNRGTRHSPIYRFFIQSPGLHEEYRSLEEMLSETVEAWRIGAYRTGPRGMILENKGELDRLRQARSGPLEPEGDRNDASSDSVGPAEDSPPRPISAEELTEIQEHVQRQAAELHREHASSPAKIIRLLLRSLFGRTSREPPREDL